jgi:hypothetical protein
MAEAEGVALNQLINVAVAEKLSALRTEKYFLERPPAPTFQRHWPPLNTLASAIRR